ncbi:threonine synthase-like 2 isoform X1 [Hydra vulgaris]|uniref:Threonine synthase-like 2 n=1 Tax=Hydra vulgaris TaxID=6087 RepID=T2MAR1_HYDVU|nr:threonine synthase-like 2 [Hydra vulgaris]
MKYQSTQGFMPYFTFEDTLYNGWLQNNGLIVPVCVPRLTNDELLKFCNLSYKEVCLKILTLFIDSDFISDVELKAIIEKAVSVFPENVAPLKELYPGAYILELFHGPTHSFKDLSLSLVGPLLNHSLEKSGKRGIVYVCTSGDTGSAAIHVMKNQPNLHTIVMFPGGNRISKLQRQLITSVNHKNIHTFSADCSCDDFDFFNQKEFVPNLKKRYPNIVVTSLNSLLWSRILAQMCHIVYAYCNTSFNLQPLRIVIPTGGAGHLTSAVLVQKLGFPIHIVAASNDKNPNLYNFLSGQSMSKTSSVTQSFTVAMDIQFPCNLDRLLYFWSDGCTDTVKKIMDSFYSGIPTKADQKLLEKIQDSVTPMSVNDDDVIATIKRCFKETQYILDPHTALGFSHYYRDKVDNYPTVYCGCASPIKFVDTLYKAEIPVPKYFTEYVHNKELNDEYCHACPPKKEDWCNYLLDYISNKISESFK